MMRSSNLSAIEQPQQHALSAEKKDLQLSLQVDLLTLAGFLTDLTDRPLTIALLLQQLLSFVLPTPANMCAYLGKCCPLHVQLLHANSRPVSHTTLQEFFQRIKNAHSLRREWSYYLKVDRNLFVKQAFRDSNQGCQFE
jgi:hypothetical protein